MSGFKLVQNPDGANFQAQAVLAFVRYLISDGIEASWDAEQKRYRAEPSVCLFDNCREQGYVIFLRDSKYAKQINIAFYEHRNSDEICAVVTDKRTFNAPVLGDITEAMTTKFDVSNVVQCGQAYQMAEWIVEQLKAFWAKAEGK